MKNIVYTSSHEVQHSRPITAELPLTLDRTKASSISTKMLVSFAAAVALMLYVSFSGLTGASTLDKDSALTLSIFIIAIWAWVFSPMSDTFVSLAAVLILVLTGILSSEEMTDSLGTSSVWLLVAAFVMAQAITASGLTQRFAATLVVRAKAPRSLMHLINISLYATAFLVPATSGRAALALPIFVAISTSLRNRKKLIKALSLLMPATVLLSAVSSYIGAGAHLITDEILIATGFEPFGFLRWLLLGAALGFVSSVICTELVYWLFVPRAERKTSINLTLDDLQEASDTPVSGSLTAVEKRVLAIMVAVVALWSTESLHGLDAVTVALLGALAVTAPKIGNIKLADGIKKAPWPLLMFMAATLAMGTALTKTETASWLAESMFAPASALGESAGVGFVVLVVVISTAAHLVIQSRSARSAILIPLVVTAAVPLGVNPAAVAFMSTAAAGFCHTMTSSAKPVALFSDVKGIETYKPKDLLKLSCWLAPVHVALILLFAFIVWPAQGMPLFTL
ncbi:MULTISPECIES: SLC13 family permease [unclassified Rothia (in: high G+C Gram-positive bacteria)]|uniref:SLC13 family permease n=1 Tax=unclassified Rothia (in: high G+C Gram-positive bacteria) TaxID=2689056 RepID=UPI00195E87A2|nr:MULTISPECIES: SLC13 family permease [unclassified Rothia (in: high G+C Gram-positive bacteria)]MBM7051247.1 anion permease [Rothia sp. ZJ1223]QRZ61044.1 anion permease [Rothia sp. ZJ932]